MVHLYINRGHCMLKKLDNCSMINDENWQRNPKKNKENGEKTEENQCINE